ncbi:potassium translocating ATPase, subunit C [Candidatus Hydrogenisulfobacillus filiaventi]|uniref:Potassium-transporting ATPase KdpC subunit n=1 Tax=Candidatus Hydrogenisulfobacillus filiaventi TaxID=2707344 RepID=A0A6F8ZD44_9FIRM|nr:potassium-transporting ATPase subunit KdpC [Bacillota bacterium]CAB1127604.1 potassium translocating ATPase, subunit C [Candidatus Hydrogenisulfobacillus filiaventi]
MGKLMRPAIGVTVALWVLVGLLYPLVMTGVSNLLFPYQAQGSPIYRHGQVVAAAHVGQYFGNAAGLFWGRPSATVSERTGKPKPYDALNSGASNLGPTTLALMQHIQARVRRLERTDPGLTPARIPPDLVESSGSGLDPDISEQAALIQIPRVARATGLSRGFLTMLVQDNVKGPQWGLFGHPRVNVVALNLELEQALARIHPTARR